MAHFILASGSLTRIGLLRAAGLDFTAVSPSVDERSLEAPLLARGASPKEIAAALADAKASSVSAEQPSMIVIGADQTLELDGRILTKPQSAAAAHEQIAALSGKTHALHSAVAAARHGAVAWRHSDSALLTMRRLSAREIDDYLAEVGEAALGSVGAYQIEGRGIRLFERIAGDHFTILGLPMLPLLAYLRGEGAVA